MSLQLAIPLAALWTAVGALLATGAVAMMLPRSRGLHTIGTAVIVVLGVVGAAIAGAFTADAVTVSQDELEDAAHRAANSVYGTQGVLTQQQLMAAVSDRLGRDVFVAVHSWTAEEASYLVRPAGEDSPSVCIRVSASAATEATPTVSTARVDGPSCD